MIRYVDIECPECHGRIIQKVYYDYVERCYVCGCGYAWGDDD